MLTILCIKRTPKINAQNILQSGNITHWVNKKSRWITFKEIKNEKELKKQQRSLEATHPCNLQNN